MLKTHRSRLCAALIVAFAVAGLPGCEKAQGDPLSAGRAALQSGNPSAALVHLRNAVANDPSNPEGRLLLGECLLVVGDAGASAIELRRARELKADENRAVPLLATAMAESGGERLVVEQLAGVRLGDPTAAAKLAAAVSQSYLLLGQPDRAARAIDEGLVANPSNPDLRMAQANLAVTQGKVREALDILAKLVADVPGSDLAWSRKADLHASLNEVAEARAAYASALKANPRQIQALVAIGLDRAASGDFKQAEESLDALRKYWPQAIGTQYLDARLKYARGDYEKARTAFAIVVNATPNSAGALVASGMNELKLGAPIQAEAQLARAVSLAPADVPARFYLAQAQLQLRRPDKASATLDPLLKDSGASPPVLVLAGSARLLQGDAAGATQLFDRAAALKPTDVVVRTELAFARAMRLEDMDAALRELEQLSGASDSTSADLKLIATRLARREVAEALKAIDVLDKKAPNGPVGPELRGRAHLLAGQPEAARKSFELAVQRDATYLPAVSQLTTMDVNSKAFDAARQRLKALLAKQPNSSPALAILAAVEATAGSPMADVTALLERSTRADPQNVSAWVALLTKHLNAADFQAAQVAAEAASRAVPDNVRILDLKGRAEIGVGNLNQATSTYGNLIRVSPESPNGYMGLAATQAAAKDLAGSSQTVRRLLAIAPNSIDAHRVAADIAIKQGLPKEGLRHARELQRLLPDDGFGHLTEARVHLVNKQLRDALASVRVAITKKRPDAAPLMLHELLRRAGDEAGARKFAEEWSSRKPADLPFLAYLGDLELAAKNWPLAISRYENLLKLDDTSASVWNNLAWAQLQAKDPRALESSRRALSLHPTRTEFLVTQATIYQDRGDFPKAIAGMKQAVNRAVDPAPIQLALARVYQQANDRPNALGELQHVLDRGKSHPLFSEARKLQVQLRAGQ